MYSFYGGKQGRSYKLTAHFDSIYDMVTAFQQGGSYTDVQYDEYVIIDTIFRKNEKNNTENGIIYRRGYDFSQPFNAEGVDLNGNNSLNPRQMTAQQFTLYANALNTEYSKDELSSGTYSITTSVPQYYDYSYKFTSASTVEFILNEEDFDTVDWNDDWTTFVSSPGGGAIYVGQIVGPEGDSPALSVIDWDDLSTYRQGNAEVFQGTVEINPKPGYNAAAANQDGYDAQGFHDEIRYGYCTIRDLQNNVTGAYISFDIPYTVFTFEGTQVAPYELPQNLITEQSDSIGHPYYKHLNISIPAGKHGQDITSLFINSIDTGSEATSGDYLAYKIKNYDNTGTPSESNPISIAPYQVIDSIEGLYKDEYAYNLQTAEYTCPYELQVNYTYGESVNFPYKMIERAWYQSVDNLPLLAGHIYVLLSDETLVDTGLLKQITSITKESDDNFYVNYNDESRNQLPIAEISEITYQGDLLLVRFKNISDESAINQTYEYGIDENGEPKHWINFGTLIKGYHIETNFNTLADLQATYPYGLGVDANGDEDPTTAERKGWVISVGHNTNIIVDITTGRSVSSNDAYIENGIIVLTEDSSYEDTTNLIIDSNIGRTLYAYDYRRNETTEEVIGWYMIQDTSASSIDPLYSVLVATSQNDSPNSQQANALNINGLWFVVETT